MQIDFSATIFRVGTGTAATIKKLGELKQNDVFSFVNGQKGNLNIVLHSSKRGDAETQICDLQFGFEISKESNDEDIIYYPYAVIVPGAAA